MTRFRYTAWDGKQSVELDPEPLFDRLTELLEENDDLRDALDRLLREGFNDGSFEIAGIDDLLERAADAIRELLEGFNFSKVFDEHRAALEEAIRREREAIERIDDADERERRSKELDRLPPELEHAVAKLARTDLDDGDARDAAKELGRDLDDIRRVSEFMRRFGDLFSGDEDLDFESALELIDRFNALKSIEEALLNRNFDAMDLEAVRDLLGADFGDSIEGLSRILQVLAEAGYVSADEGRTVLGPKGARRIGELALREIHRSLDFDIVGAHELDRRGGAEEALGATKPYSHGDAMRIDVGSTLANALRRKPAKPLAVEAADFEVHEPLHSTRSATVLLLDMSWSMSWEGRFAAAKRVALALETLMRTRYRRDYFAVVGFYTRAVEIPLPELANVSWNMGDPFTNLQDGLRVGADLLMRQPGRNKSMIVITDGQPTAYFADGKLFCEWPVSMGGLSTRATIETLAEVKRVTRKGIRINTFMLDDAAPLRAFVEKMTEINKGRAFYTTPETLGRFLLVDYVDRRRRVI